MSKSVGLTDSNGRTWRVFERDDGSVVVYYTRPGMMAHFVVYDTLDSTERKPLVNEAIDNDT